MSCWVFFRRCSLYRGLANTAMHLTRPLQLPVAQRDPEPAAFCGQVMASVNSPYESASNRLAAEVVLAPLVNPFNGCGGLWA
jgi:hypothetical protein